MGLEIESLTLLVESLRRLDGGFAELADFSPEIDLERMREVLEEVAFRMRDNFPYHHPLYAGQMLKPPHPIARLAYCLALWINPNNHALDGGRASSAMEKEAVAELAKLFGWQRHLGHLTSGGTMANLEALWVSGRLAPGKKVVASEQAHYTHRRISEVLRLDFEAIPVDARAKMDLRFLEKLLQSGEVGTVVATVGTTASGSIDPLPQIFQLKQKYGFRLHVDAAYGGYFTLAENLTSEARAAFDTLDKVDSIVVDPHKHGLQPYGCGSVLFRDPSVGAIYKHESPYTYFTSKELHLGEISLECSRPGASAVALWATQKLLPLKPSGEFARALSSCRKAALDLHNRLENDNRFLTLFPPELDIVIWAVRAQDLSEISRLSRRFFNAAAQENLHLALVELPLQLVEPYWKEVSLNRKYVTCLRSCLMKPEHQTWIDEIWSILDRIN
ncbi:MAG: aspartate aminotransferase family protein [Deltaproteobacteria bacterium]|nr:aspartate aminotransferase family protein [Deltaproteobacteria bacterium]